MTTYDPPTWVLGRDAPKRMLFTLEMVRKVYGPNVAVGDVLAIEAQDGLQLYTVEKIDDGMDVFITRHDEL